MCKGSNILAMHDSCGQLSTLKRRQRGCVVRMLESKDPEFKSCTDHSLDLSQELPGLTPRLCLNINNWSASCHLGFLTC